MEEVERTQVVIVCPQQRTRLAQCNPYAMEVDRRRNCYTCGGVGHRACHCIKWGQRSRMEYGEGIKENYEHSDNLKGKENLESLD